VAAIVRIGAMRLPLPAVLLLALATALPAEARIGDPPDLVTAGKTGDLALAMDSLLRNDDPDQPDEDGNTPLYYSIRNDHLEIVKALLQKHASPVRIGPDGKFPLFWAAELGNVEIIDALIKAGAKVDQNAKGGMTPLMAAASKGQDDAILALLAAGAKPDLLDYTGRDALGWATDSHNQRAIQILRASIKK